MNQPLISARAELVRAATHFMAKRQTAKDYPERAGIRFEAAAVGVLIISMDDDAMIVLRDPAGSCDCGVTVGITPSFFDSARREQRARKLEGPHAILNIGGGKARLSGVEMAAPTIDLPYPNWRRLMPGRAFGLPPAITPHDAERIGLVANILAGTDETGSSGVRYAGVVDRDRAVALASFDGWPDAFAVVAPAPRAAATQPWQRPLWTVTGAMPEARAS